MSASDIYADNPYELEFTVQNRLASTGALVAATGILDLHGFIASDPAGSTIHADLELNLTERSGKPGTYAATIPASLINLRLFPTYDGQTLYVVAKNANIHAYAKVKARSKRPLS